MDDAAWKKIIVLLTCIIFFVIWFKDRPHSMTSERTEQRLMYHIENVGRPNGKDLPVIIALHGNGDTPKNFFETLLAKHSFSAKIILVRGPYKQRFGYGWPLSGPESKKWNDTLADLASTITQSSDYSIKPVLIGFSGGGFMAYTQAALYPDLYHGIITISGGIDPSNIKQDTPINDVLPIYALHGKHDQVISLQRGRAAVHLLEDLGRNVQLTILPGDHLSVFMDGREPFLNILNQSLNDSDAPY